MARGAVVVIVSDGWERADPGLLGEQMARLARLAHRVIWVNPRSAAEDYEPLVGGMVAALPHVDEFLSGHSLEALEELVAAIQGASDRTTQSGHARRSLEASTGHRTGFSQETSRQRDRSYIDG
jgi:hypothetical protein